MFGTDRAIDSFQLEIQPLADPNGQLDQKAKTIEFGRPSMRSFVNWSRVQYRRQLTWLTLR